MKSGKIHDFRAPGQGLLARSIEERLEAAGVQLEPAAHAHALAGSFFSLLDWWIEKSPRTS